VLRLLALLCLLGPPGTETARAVAWVASRADRPPLVDGRLDDLVWSRAPAARHFVDFAPQPGRAPSQATEVRAAWDDDALYLAFRCLDSHPERIRGRLARRDAAADDDWVGVILDPSGDGRGALEVLVNPRGCVMDAAVTPGSRDDVAVDYDVAAAAARDGAGWSAELAVPWAAMGAALTRRMTAFALRQIRRTGERASWPAIDVSDPNWLARGATLERARAAGRRAELRPVLTVQRAGDRGPRPRLGATGAATPWPGLSLALALRPDFSHVEADAPQVSLNRRFPVSCPEKRAFFLEDRELFEVAATGGGLASFFQSRSIEAPAAAVRLAGRVGRRHRLGLLWALDEPEGGSPARVAWVRGRSRLTGASYVGACAGLRVAPRGPGDGAAGLDADLVLARGARLTAHVLRRVGSALPAGARHAAAARLSWSGALRSLSLAYQEIAPGFAAATGFLRRRDLRETSAEGACHLFPRLPACTRVTGRIQAVAATDAAGAPTERLARLTVRFETLGPGALQVSRAVGAEWTEGARFRAGDWQLAAETAALSWLRASWSGSLAATPIYGAGAQGETRTVSAALTLRPSAWLSLSMEETQVRLRPERPPGPATAERVRRGLIELQPHRGLRLRGIADRGRGPGQPLVDLMGELALASGAVVQLGWGSAGSGADRARVAFFKAAWVLRASRGP
jgi:hypothetical protein